MYAKSVMMSNQLDNSSQPTHVALVEQVLWLIRLRWLAAGALIVFTILGHFVFPVLSAPMLIYVCAVILLM